MTDESTPADQATTQWAKLERVVSQFETAWRQGERPAIDDFLPVGGIEEGAALVELVLADLEFRVKAGESVRVESYLDRYQRLRDEPALVVELLASEFQFRRRAEPSLAVDEYVERFPELREAICERFTNATAARTARPRSNTSAVIMQAEAPPEEIRFQRLRSHAQGGLGEVFVANDRELHREVALKEIRREYADDLNCRDRFVLEARITGGLEHPGIVPVYGMGQYSDSRPYYAMRFIQGEDLKDAVERYHAPQSEAATASGRPLLFRDLLGRFVGVCNAVAYAHSRGIVHRDLKPGNVMLGKFGETLLVDWGLAKAVGRDDVAGSDDETTLRPGVNESSLRETRMGEAIGTPAYMSPEQATGRLDQVGPASDIYSLGATLYTILTGRSPTQASDLKSALEKAQKGDFPPPRALKPDVPKALEAVCLKAMAFDPLRRYAKALDLAEDIEHWLADEPVSAYSEPLTQRTRRWARKHRALTSSAAVAVLVATISSAVGLGLLSAANRDLTEANRQAETNLQKAEASLNLVDETVDRYFTKIATEKLLDEPGMAPLQRDLLKQAQAHYANIVSRGASDRETWKKAARAYWELALITEKIGSMDEAVDQFQKSLAIWQRLDREQKLSNDEFLEIAFRQIEMALTQFRFGRYQESVKTSQAALEGLLDLRKRYDNPKVRYELARTYHNLAVTYWDSGQTAQARETRAQAVAEITSLVRDVPSSFNFVNMLAFVYHSLSIQHFESNELDKALEINGKALEIRQQLARDNPQRPDAHFLLARVQAFRGNLEQVLGHYRKSLVFMKEAEANLKKVASRHSLVTRYQRELAMLYNNLGAAQSLTGDDAAARSSYDQAQQISEKLMKSHPRVPRFRKARGVARVRQATLEADPAKRRQLVLSGIEDLKASEVSGSRNDRMQLFYFEAMYQRGFQEMEAGELAKAAATFNTVWKQAQSLNPNALKDPNGIEVLYSVFLKLALILEQQKKRAELITLATEFREMVKGDGIKLLFVARAFASASSIKGGPEESPDAETQRLRAADLALKTVTEANAAGLHQSAAFWKGLMQGDTVWRHFHTSPALQPRLAAFVKSIPAVKRDTKTYLSGKLAFYKFLRDFSHSNPTSQQLKLGVWQVAAAAATDHMNANDNATARRLLQAGLATALSIDREKLQQEGVTFPLDQLAETHMQLGVATYRHEGEPGYILAEPDFRKAVAIWTGMKSKDMREELQAFYRLLVRIWHKTQKSISPKNQAGLAETLAYLGSATRRMGRVDEARGHYRQSIAVYRELAARHRGNIGYELGAVRSYGNLGRLETAAGRLPEAVKWYTQGLDQLKKLHAAGRSNADSRWLHGEFQAKVNQLNRHIEQPK